MDLPIIITPLPNQAGFSARIPALDLSVEAPTADEAQSRLAALIADRLQQGIQIRSIRVPSPPPPGGWLPDDELTREWLQHIQDYRAECDARDREELDRLESQEKSL